MKSDLARKICILRGAISIIQFENNTKKYIMPIYEYKCLSCGSHFEKMQKASDAPFETCEKCGGKLEKQWSLSGFQFKGAGWYVTDYAGKTKDTGAEKSEKSENVEKTGKSSDGESTAKTESASKPASDNAASSKKETVSKKD